MKREANGREEMTTINIKEATNSFLCELNLGDHVT